MWIKSKKDLSNRLSEAEGLQRGDTLIFRNLALNLVDISPNNYLFVFGKVISVAEIDHYFAEMDADGVNHIIQNEHPVEIFRRYLDIHDIIIDQADRSLMMSFPVRRVDEMDQLYNYLGVKMPERKSSTFKVEEKEDRTCFSYEGYTIEAQGKVKYEIL